MKHTHRLKSLQYHEMECWPHYVNDKVGYSCDIPDVLPNFGPSWYAGHTTVYTHSLSVLRRIIKHLDNGNTDKATALYLADNKGKPNICAGIARVLIGA